MSIDEKKITEIVSKFEKWRNSPYGELDPLTPEELNILLLVPGMGEMDIIHPETMEKINALIPVRSYSLGDVNNEE